MSTQHEIQLINPILGLLEKIDFIPGERVHDFIERVKKKLCVTKLRVFVGGVNVSLIKYLRKVDFFEVEKKPFIIWPAIDIDVSTMIGSHENDTVRTKYMFGEKTPEMWAKHGKFFLVNGEEFQPKSARHMIMLVSSRKLRFREGSGSGFTYGRDVKKSFHMDEFNAGSSGGFGPNSGGYREYRGGAFNSVSSDGFGNQVGVSGGAFNSGSRGGELNNSESGSAFNFGGSRGGYRKTYHGAFNIAEYSPVESRDRSRGGYRGRGGSRGMSQRPIPKRKKKRRRDLKKFIDIEKSKVESFKFSNDSSIPDYLTCVDGFNVFAECKTLSCVAHGKTVVVPCGYKDVDMLSDTFKCPECHEEVEAMNCGFTKCWWNYCGEKIDGVRVEVKWKRSKSHSYDTFIHTDMKTDQEKHSGSHETLKEFCAQWKTLKFKIRSPSFCCKDDAKDELLDPDMSFCPICLDNVLNMSELFETKCLHNYHKECFFAWAESKKSPYGSSQTVPCCMCRADVDMSQVTIPRKIKLKNETHYHHGIKSNSGLARAYTCTQVKGLCTITEFGQTKCYQGWYECKTCDLQGKHGVCERCKDTCHEGHDVVHSSNSPCNFQCCCGNGEGKSPCKCLVKEAVMDDDDDDKPHITHRDLESWEVGNISKLLREKKCTFTATGRNFYKQKWYHCKTCNLERGVGVCESCKDMCHKGHQVEESQKSPSGFFCDCGAGVNPLGSCKCLKESVKRKRDGEEDDEDDEEREIKRRKIDALQIDGV